MCQVLCLAGRRPRPGSEPGLSSSRDPGVMAEPGSSHGRTTTAGLFAGDPARPAPSVPSAGTPIRQRINMPVHTLGLVSSLRGRMPRAEPHLPRVTGWARQRVATPLGLGLADDLLWGGYQSTTELRGQARQDTGDGLTRTFGATCWATGLVSVVHPPNWPHPLDSVLPVRKNGGAPSVSTWSESDHCVQHPTRYQARGRQQTACGEGSPTAPVEGMSCHRMGFWRVEARPSLQPPPVVSTTRTGGDGSLQWERHVEQPQDCVTPAPGKMPQGPQLPSVCPPTPPP